MRSAWKSSSRPSTNIAHSSRSSDVLTELVPRHDVGVAAGDVTVPRLILLSLEWEQPMGNDHAQEVRQHEYGEAVSRQVRLQLYQEVCRSHDAITDFRAKLLALLPLATGAGAFLLLDRGVDRSALGPAGLFGFAVFVGLFVYELRGVQTCKMLRRRAAQLEEKLRVPVKQSQYREREPAQLWGLVGAEFAAWIVYGAILFSWLFVAGVGFQWWEEVPSLILLVGYLVVLVGAAGLLIEEYRRESLRPGSDNS